MKPSGAKIVPSAPKRLSRRDPESNKRALISATLDAIAEIGITDTTVSKITERAELSRGMIHLHFGSKSQLLAAAAKSYGEEYFEEIDRCVQQAAKSPEAIVMAIVMADLSEALLNERSTRIWHAFRGAAGSDAKIAVYSSTRDKRLRAIIHKAFNEIARDYDEDENSILARDATFGLLALLEGMWVDFLSNANAFSREVAVSIIRRFIAGLFPRHFQQRF